MTKKIEQTPRYGFGLLGAAGYVAPRHIQAIFETGNDLLYACDVTDSVGVLDRHFPQCKFFLSLADLEEDMRREKRQLSGALEEGTLTQNLDFLSICTPNYLHFPQIKFGLKNNMHVICEKPLVLTEKEVHELKIIEQETGKRVFSILQLRLHPQIIRLKALLESQRHNSPTCLKVSLNYVTSRGPWYKKSWKFDINKSGGVASNIGIHFFDMLIQLFGYPDSYEILDKSDEQLKGILHCPYADVNFFLSIKQEDLPLNLRNTNQRSWRELIIDGSPFDFTNGFTDLHIQSYKEILAGRGFGLADALPAVRLCESIRLS